MSLFALVINFHHKKLISIISIIFSFVVILNTQILHFNAIKNSNEPSLTGKVNPQKTSSSSSNSKDNPTGTFNIGETVTQSNGMTIRVNSVEFKRGNHYNSTYPVNVLLSFTSHW